MNRWLTVGCLAAVAAFVLVGGAAVETSSGAGAGLPAAIQETTSSTLDGVFTPAQARRGRGVYDQNCSSCHGHALRGGEMAPSVAGADFIVFWTEVPVGALFNRIKLTMPEDGPGRLSDQEYNRRRGLPARPERLSGGRERAVHAQGRARQDHDRRRRVTPGGRAATRGVPSAARAGVVPDRWRGSRTAPAPAPGLPAAPTARSGCGSDQSGERRLRLRSPAQPTLPGVRTVLRRRLLARAGQGEQTGGILVGPDHQGPIPVQIPREFHVMQSLLERQVEVREAVAVPQAELDRGFGHTDHRRTA